MLKTVRVLVVSLFVTGFTFVSAHATTTTAIAILAAGSPVSSVGAGTVITLSATVVSGATIASGGQVNFCDAAKFCTDIHLLATAQITPAGTATYAFRPGVGTHSYKAVYLGTKNAPPSASAATALLVTAPTTANNPTTTVLTPTGHPGDYTLTATVSSLLTYPPTGPVSFFDITNANYPLGTATLTPGSRTLSLEDKSSINPGGAPLAADFNGDGIPDLALFNGGLSSGSLAIYIGNGDGTFTALPSVVVDWNGGPIATADFNQDGKLDLICGGPDYVTVLLGNGDGTFATAPSLSITSANGIAAGDLNHDGVEDLMISGDGQIVTYLGKGNGAFTALAPPIAVPGQFVFLADLNGDGLLDLALEYYSSKAYNPTNAPISSPPAPPLQLLEVRLGNGDGSFGPGTPVSVYTNNYLSLAAQVTIADFNGDGNLDLALITADEPDHLLLLLGSGDGFFAKPIQSTDALYYNFAQVADFNNDGIADLAAFVQFPLAPETPDLITLIGNGDGTFIPGIAGTDPGRPSAGLVADFDGDGYPDIAAVESDGSISIFVTEFMSTTTAAITNVSIVGTSTHYVDAQYSGDATYLGSLSPAVPLTADTIPTSLALSATPAAGSAFGQPVTITASLSPFTAQDHNATGTVTFSSNGIMLGTGMVSGGVATLTTTALTAGSDDLVATYPGDENFRPSTARDLIYPVEPLKAQTINFPQPGSPVSVNAPPITLVATASSGLPVTFKLVSGPATLTGSVLTLTGLGTIVVAADQPGNSIYAAAPEVTRSILVTPPATVTLVASAPLVFLLNPVTLTATISPSGSTATGTVTFFDGTQTIGTAPPQGGIATISVSSLPVGPHNITAVWSGDAGYAAATSVPSALTVEDFFVAFADAQITIIHGGTATLSLQLTPVGGPATAGPITVSLSGEPTGSEMTVTPTSIATGASSGTVTVVIATPNYPTGPFALNSVGRSRSVLALIAFGGLLLPFARRRKHLRSLWGSALLAIISMALLVGAIGCGSGWSTEVFQIQATATSGALSHTATATLTSKCSNGQPACPVISQ